MRLRHLQPAPASRGGGQRGVALATALVFLVVITLVGLVAMRSSVVELRLARNTQFEIEAAQTAQAVVDAVVANLDNFSVDLQPGGIACYDSGSDAPAACGAAFAANLLDVQNALFQDGIYAEVRRLPPAQVPPPAPLLTSMDKFSAAAFAVRGQYNRAAAGLGAADIEQGVLRLVPRSPRIR